MKLLNRQGGLWLLLFLCWAPLASAQSQLEKVSSVVVTNIGPKVASDDLIRANIHIKPGDTYIRTSIDQDVLNLYDTGFFINIRVTDTHTDQGVVLTYILQGKLRLTGISVEGNTKFSTAKLLKKAASKIGDPLDEQKLFNDSQEMQKMYEKSGYQHTIVKYVLGNLDYEAGKASVTFQVQETPKIKIVGIDFSGISAFTASKLRKQIKTKKHWMFSWVTGSDVYKEDQFQEDKDKLAEFYHEAGYIDFEIKDVRFTNPRPGTMRIEFVVFEGTRIQSRLGDVSGEQTFHHAGNHPGPQTPAFRQPVQNADRRTWARGGRGHDVQTCVLGTRRPGRRGFFRRARLHQRAAGRQFADRENPEHRDRHDGPRI